MSKISKSQAFVKMQKLLGTFDIRYENGQFFHKIFGKNGESHHSEKMKNRKLAFFWARNI